MPIQVNPRIDLDPLTVASLFAEDNVPPAYLDTTRRATEFLRNRMFDEFKALVGSVLDTQSSVECYYPLAQWYSLLKKIPFKGLDRKRTAILKFADAERQCASTNARLSSHFWSGRGLMYTALSLASRECHRVMGPCDEKTLIGLARPGSGACIGTQNRYRTSLSYKLDATDFVCTKGAEPLVRALLDMPGWALSGIKVPKDLTITEANRISFVPKDMFSDRSIALEPSLNVWLQLGVHEWLSKRLAREGNSIRDQSRNQVLARLGSISGRVSTIDLSSASDTMSYELVRFMVSPAWFSYLLRLRCSNYRLDHSTQRYEKFSSMGNGFTFALETVIFLSLARACTMVCNANIPASAYGDDIIIDTQAALLLVELLEYCGFSVNTEKSFFSGPFRESCGADFHRGRTVTTQKLREQKPLHTDVYNLLNRMDPVFRMDRTRKYILSKARAKRKIVYGLPCENTDSCLFTTLPYLKGIGGVRWSSKLQTYKHRTIVFVPRSERSGDGGYGAALLVGGSDNQRPSLRTLGSFRERFVTPGRSPVVPSILRDLFP